MEVFTQAQIHSYKRVIQSYIGNYNKHYRLELNKVGYYGILQLIVFEKRMFHKETLIKYIEFRPIDDNEYVAFTMDDNSLDRATINNYIYNVLPNIIH